MLNTNNCQRSFETIWRKHYATAEHAMIDQETRMTRLQRITTQQSWQYWHSPLKLHYEQYSFSHGTAAVMGTKVWMDGDQPFSDLVMHLARVACYTLIWIPSFGLDRTQSHTVTTLLSFDQIARPENVLLDTFDWKKTSKSFNYRRTMSKKIKD